MLELFFFFFFRLVLLVVCYSSPCFSCTVILVPVQLKLSYLRIVDTTGFIRLK